MQHLRFSMHLGLSMDSGYLDKLAGQALGRRCGDLLDVIDQSHLSFQSNQMQSINPGKASRQKKDTPFIQSRARQQQQPISSVRLRRSLFALHLRPSSRRANLQLGR